MTGHQTLGAHNPYDDLSGTFLQENHKLHVHKKRHHHEVSVMELIVHPKTTGQGNI